MSLYNALWEGVCIFLEVIDRTSDWFTDERHPFRVLLFIVLIALAMSLDLAD